MDLHEYRTQFGALTAAIAVSVQGKPEQIHLALVCLLARGHLLIEDTPGLGKTTLATALADATGLTMRRIQFTPDLLPTDITGTDVITDPARPQHKTFQRGPVFANVVVADEINRASPKTQSALLQAMQEREVSFGNRTHQLPAPPDDPHAGAAPDEPYLVLATQNPLDAEGTYALPAAQLDRFLMRISMGYPSRDAELAVLRADRDGPAASDARRRSGPVTDAARLIEMIHLAARVQVRHRAADYILDLVEATRAAARSLDGAPRLRLGASPRGSLGLMRAARVRAAAAGRDFVTADDIAALAPAVLTHRLVPAAGQQSAAVLDHVLSTVEPRPLNADHLTREDP